ncbi:MAG: sulfatase [bacterium]|nr:sulfatase [bacterium]
MRLYIHLVVLMLVGCGYTDRESGEIPSPVFDRQVIDLESDRAVLRFHSSPESIKLGSGWYDVEATAQGPAAWSAKKSVLYFARPLAERLDFIASCSPFVYPDAPPQAMTLRVNGTDLRPTALSPGFQTVRFSLPHALLKPGLNTLKMKFAYAAKPSDVGDSEDQRSLAVLFRFLAVAPRHLTEDEALERLNRLDLDSGRLTLRPGAGAMLPLPAASSVTVTLGLVTARSEGSLLALEVLEADGSTREVFRGEPAAVTGRSFDIRRSGARPAWLRLRWISGSGAGAAAKASAVFDIRETFIVPERPLASARSPGSPPHVFIYMIDTLRADALEPYGAELPTSPRIAEFAQDAVVFERAWSASAWTYPATASVLTGSYPFRHGLTELERQPPSHAPTLGEWLGQRGYHTLAISQSYIVNTTYGLDRGFRRFYLNDALGKRGLESGNVRWFLWHHLKHRKDPEQPLFCYIHTVDPHALYRPQGEDRRFAEANPGRLEAHLYNPNIFMQQQLGRDERETRHLLGLYLGEVLFADRQFGAFIDFLKFHGLYENSIIALLSDHGEEFFEHEGFAHSRTLFEEMLQVPLIVKFPHGWRAGTRVRARATTLDLAATILDLVGEEPSLFSLDGMSLRELAADESSFRDRIIFAETRVTGHGDQLAEVDLAAIAVGDIKCIHSGNNVSQFFGEIPTFRAYELSIDPGEERPLPLTDGNAMRCTQALERWVAVAQANRPGSDAADVLSAEARSRLRALGYLD